MGKLQRIMVGDWAVAPTQNLIERDGQSVRLEPRVMDVLVYFANHAGEVISTAELMGAVWQGRVVGDGAVYQRINQLRQALGDSTEDTGFIETIAKRGYRLTAAVSPWVSASDEEPDLTHARQRLKRRISFAGAGILALTLALVVYVADEDHPDVLPNSLAVLPLDNLSPNPDNAYFAAGLHEEIVSRLANVGNIRVISRTSVLPYEDSDLSIPEIARELNVGAVMKGSVRYAEDRVRITMQLIDAETAEHLWSRTYDRKFEDIFAIESDISMNIAGALEAEFSPSEQAGIEKIPTKSLPAYASYLRALAASTYESHRSAIDQAIALDSEFALAYAHRAIGETGRLVGLTTNTSPDEALEVQQSIDEDARRALALDPTIGRAHAALAALHRANWRGAEAELAFQRALELSPRDVDILDEYGEFKLVRGQYEAAIRLRQQAIELDPNTGPGQLALTYRYAGRWDAAAAAFQAVLNRDPASVGNLSWNIHSAYVEASRGNAAEAVKRLQLAEQLGTTRVYRLAQMALAYSLAGRPDDAERIFAQFVEQATQEGIGDGWWAYAHVAVKDYAKALRRVEAAVDKRLSLDQTALFALSGNSWGDPALQKPEFRALLDGLWID